MTTVDLKEGMTVNLVKINEKPAVTTASGTDVLPVTDPVTGAIKQITVTNFLSPVFGGVGIALTSTTPTAGINAYSVSGGAGTYTNFLSAASTPIVFDNTIDSMATKEWQMRKNQSTGYWFKYEYKTSNTYAQSGGSDKTLQDIDDEIHAPGEHAAAYQFGLDYTTPSIATTNNYCFVQKGFTVPHNSHIEKVNVWASGTGILYVIVLRLSNISGNYEEISRDNISVVNGDNGVTVNIPVKAGDKIGLGNGASIFFKYASGSHKGVAANIASLPAAFTQSALEDGSGFDADLGVNFEIAEVDIDGGLLDLISQKAEISYVDELDISNVKQEDVTVELGRNRFDKDTMVLANKLIDDSGNLLDVIGAKACRIPVDVGLTYAFFQSQYDATAGGSIRLVDNALDLVETFDGISLDFDTTGTGRIVTIPVNVKYIELNLYFSDTNYADITDTLQFEKGDTRTSYVPYKFVVSKINGLDIKSDSNTNGESIPYYDLNVVFMGDSITWLPSPKSYLEHILERIHFKNVNNVSLSGAAWTHTASTAYNISDDISIPTADNVIWNQFNVLKNGIDNDTMKVPDLIVINAGVNGQDRPFGLVSTTFANGTTIIDKDADEVLTMTDCIRYVVELILVEWPLIQIILITPMQMGVADNATIRNIGDLIEGCADRLSLQSIRQDKHNGIYGFNEISQDIFLYDNLHPNPAGALRMGKFLTLELKNKIVI